MQYYIYNNSDTENKEVQVAVADIYDELLLERIRAIQKQRVIPIKKTTAEIRNLIRAQNKTSADSILQKLEQQKKQNHENTGSWESEPIINLVDSLMDEALKDKATDIHLEPAPNEFRIRFRKDGLLCSYKTLPGWIAEPVLIRLKLLADVDITERRIPHDGSFKFQGAFGEANVRLSTLPVHDGEKCVLRLLPAQDDGQTLDRLGFSPAIQNALRNAFAAPQGLLLITGPTGSGKTSTLYSGLREIIHRQINVVTIEDPVEYKLEGANQVQVNEKCGFTFAVALRSILRQDPDVILVGEIRDPETAQIALRAAQTGHLVLATLHTNSAKAATDRMQDLGVNINILRESLLGIVAQRLLRKTSGGRTAVVEFLGNDGNFVDGNLEENAKRLFALGVVTANEISRVLGDSVVFTESKST
ncbi:MAG: GspE/PulE family protein [Fibrobacter sp.]|nr:GspE/PulE family protein [Fibrobacter sp.]